MMKQSTKCLLYIVAGVILHTAFISLLFLTFLRVRNPKLRLSSVAVENLRLNSSTSSPSFSMKLHAQVTVKNSNFGHFKFDEGTATISYRGSAVGEAVIAKSSARARSTKKMNVTVTLASTKGSSDSHLSSDISSGRLRLTCLGKLSGKVHLLKIVKKKKSAEMNCTMDVNTKIQAIENLHCK